MAAPKKVKKSESTSEVTGPEKVQGTLYDPEDDPSLKLENNEQAEVVRREFIVLPGPAGYEATDCTTAVVQEALNLGYRPTGDAHMESVKDHTDGLHKVVTWAVPVVLVKPVEGSTAQSADKPGVKRAAE
ncbi:MAG: hypothetical protein OJJ54_13525 [Pseudonocardia sp.]|nr:hypothetical protein [Pseudonocardia sp.]